MPNSRDTASAQSIIRHQTRFIYSFSSSWLPVNCSQTTMLRLQSTASPTRWHHPRDASPYSPIPDSSNNNWKESPAIGGEGGGEFFAANRERRLSIPTPPYPTPTYLLLHFLPIAIGTALKAAPETALELHCTGTALELHWNCTGIALELHWNSTGTVLELHWNCTGIPLEHSCTETALEHSCTETALERR